MSSETYYGVEFCDLSAYDKERVNQGILRSDQEVDDELKTMEMADPDGPGLSLEN